MPAHRLSLTLRIYFHLPRDLQYGYRQYSQYTIGRLLSFRDRRRWFRALSDGSLKSRSFWDLCCFIAICTGVGYFLLLAFMGAVHCLGGGSLRGLLVKFYGSTKKPASPKGEVVRGNGCIEVYR